MRRYKLLKDLPTFKAGDEFLLEYNGCLYLQEGQMSNHRSDRVMAYHKKTLDRFPNILEDWFEEIKPNSYWCIDWTEEGGIYHTESVDVLDEFNKEIGNYFPNKWEAKVAVDKLKAWKRLRDNGFKFDGHNLEQLRVHIWLDHGYSEMKHDLDILFGGEE